MILFYYNWKSMKTLQYILKDYKNLTNGHWGLHRIPNVSHFVKIAVSRLYLKLELLVFALSLYGGFCSALIYSFLIDMMTSLTDFQSFV